MDAKMIERFLSRMSYLHEIYDLAKLLPGFNVKADGCLVIDREFDVTEAERAMVEEIIRRLNMAFPEKE